MNLLYRFNQRFCDILGDSEKNVRRLADCDNAFDYPIVTN